MSVTFESQLLKTFGDQGIEDSLFVCKRCVGISINTCGAQGIDIRRGLGELILLRLGFAANEVHLPCAV